MSLQRQPRGCRCSDASLVALAQLPQGRDRALPAQIEEPACMTCSLPCRSDQGGGSGDRPGGRGCGGASGGGHRGFFLRPWNLASASQKLATALAMASIRVVLTWSPKSARRDVSFIRSSCLFVDAATPQRTVPAMRSATWVSARRASTIRSTVARRWPCPPSGRRAQGWRDIRAFAIMASICSTVRKQFFRGRFAPPWVRKMGAARLGWMSGEAGGESSVIGAGESTLSGCVPVDLGWSMVPVSL